MSEAANPPVVVGFTGASGAPLARALVERLLARPGPPVVLVATSAAEEVWRQEVGEPLEDAVARWGATGRLIRYPIDAYAAPIASGSRPTRGMVVVPCSMGTLAGIAHGLSRNLLERAADVHLKEGRRLVLVPREMPLSALHLENLLRLARLGVRILPPLLTFYHHPQTLEDAVAFVVDRILVALGLEAGMGPETRYSPPEGVV